jgi:hypothetical protein
LLLLGHDDPFSNWSVAQQNDLNTLYAHIPSGSGTPADFLTNDVPGVPDSPDVWTGLLSNGVWNASSVTDVARNYAQATPSAPGLAFIGTPDEQDDGNGYIPSLDISSCGLGGSGTFCPEPTWANGSASGVYDLKNGGQPQPQPTHAQQKPKPDVLQNWDNWTSNRSYCVDEGFFSCDHYRVYPQIVGFLKLPVLFDRTPGDLAAECYYRPASNEPTAGNGCLAPLPSQ